MRVLLIALQNTVPGPASPEEQTRWAELGSPMRTARMEEEHVLALARAMRDGGRLAPMLACRENSHLHARALQLNLPVLTVNGASPGNPFNFWHLWRWQRRHQKLLVQTMGQEAMPLGRSVLRMRPAGSTLLAHAFPLRPPQEHCATGKAFKAAHRVLCGSLHVMERLNAVAPTPACGRPPDRTDRGGKTEAREPDDMGSAVAKKGDTYGTGGTGGPDSKARSGCSGMDGKKHAERSAARQDCGEKSRTLPLGHDTLTLLAPGMSLDDFSPVAACEKGHPDSSGSGGAESQRFVFGLADALAPRSGAQVVMRAMSAIWQRDDLPPWEVRALGGGPRLAEILDEAESLGVASRLSILNEQHLPDVLSRCHAWIAPGSSPEELPENLWAGVAAGLPLLCSQSPLHLERLSLEGSKPQSAALLVEENDPQALAKAMIDLMQNADLRRDLVRGGQALRPLVGLEAFAARACTLYTRWCRQLGWLEPGHDDAPRS